MAAEPDQPDFPPPGDTRISNDEAVKEVYEAEGGTVSHATDERLDEINRDLAEEEKKRRERIDGVVAR